MNKSRNNTLFLAVVYAGPTDSLSLGTSKDIHFIVFANELLVRTELGDIFFIHKILDSRCASLGTIRSRGNERRGCPS